MKNTIRIFAIMAEVAGLVACEKYADFTTAPYVTFDSRSMTVNEDAGTLEIPVSAHNITGDCTVTFNIDGPAQAGVDYELVDNASGTLNFNPDKTSDVLKVKVIPHIGTYTGNTNLRISIASLTDGVQKGAITSFPIAIIDKDIPVDWAYVQGTWKAQDYLLTGATDGDAYEIVITKVDDSNVIITNLWGGETDLEGTIEFDTANNTATVSLPARQVVFDASAYGYGNLLLVGQNASGGWAYAPVNVLINAQGITIGPWNMVITEGEDAGYLWDNSGYMTELSK